MLTAEQRIIKLHEYCALSLVLLSSLLVFISLGQFQNWDALTEYQAASGVIQWGFPFTSPGILINQPPLGYYIDAIFFKIFGLAYDTGVWVTALFGLGSVFLVYEIGKMLYGKTTAFLSAALFGIMPWQVIMSRTFLIDSQSLFFSLLYLLVGMWAIKKGSARYFLLTGILFGLALLTKAFAVYMLIPLLLIYIIRRQKTTKLVARDAALVFLPALFLNLLWYEGLTEEGALAIFRHNDFKAYFPPELIPSSFFIPSYFIRNVGILLLAAVVLSLLLSISQRRLLSKFLVSDFVCFSTVTFILGFDAFLVLGMNLWVPYISIFKYAYPTLPFLCWLTASFADKSLSLPNWRNFSNRQRIMILSTVAVGLLLVISAIGANMARLDLLTKSNTLLLVVEGDYGYSFTRFPPTWSSGLVVIIQPLAFVLTALGLFWFNFDKLKPLLSSLKWTGAHPRVNESGQ